VGVEIGIVPLRKPVVANTADATMQRVIFLYNRLVDVAIVIN